MFNQRSTVLRKTKTAQDKMLDLIIQDIDELAGIQEGSNELFEILANGNTTGGTNLSVSSADTLIFNNGGFTASVTEPTLAGNIVLTLPTITGTFALMSDITANDELSEILAIGNTTGANDISVDTGQGLVNPLGARIDLSYGGARTISMTLDDGLFGENWWFMEPTYIGSVVSLGVANQNSYIHQGEGTHYVDISDATGAKTERQGEVSFFINAASTGISGTDSVSVLFQGNYDVAAVNGTTGLSTDTYVGVFIGAPLSSIGIATASSAIMAGGNNTINGSLINVAIVGGDTITAAVSNALYTNQLRIQKAANAFDGIFDVGTLTATRTYSFPNKDITVAGIVDITNIGNTDLIVSANRLLDLNSNTFAISYDGATYASSNVYLDGTVGQLSFATSNFNVASTYMNMTFSGAVALSVVSGIITLNDSKGFDTRIEGLTNVDLLYVDQSTDRVGIGTATPGVLFDVNGAMQVQGAFTITDANNVVLGTTTGNKIGTATTQKIGFWNATPVVQPTHIVDPAAMAAITGAANAAVTASTAPAGGTGTAAGGYDTAVNRDLMIASLTATQADVAAILAQADKSTVDVAALKTAVDENNAAIDSINAMLASTGLTASV